MGRISAARRAAWELLGEARQREARARDLLRAAPQMDAMDGRDRALCMRLVMGVTQTSGRLDKVIDSHLTGRRHLEPRVRDALRVGAFELLYLSTPAAGAVSQGAELVRVANPRAVGLGNAVLRRIGESDAPATQSAYARVRDGSLDPSDLAAVSGLPMWILNEARRSMGDAPARWLALNALEPAPVYVSGNRVLVGPEEFEGELESAGLDPRRVTDFGAYELGRPAGLARSGLVGAAVAVPSDLAAQMVARIAAPRPRDRMMEIGQGRGTKTLLLQSAAVELGGLASIVGVDNVRFKRDVAAGRMRRARLGEAVTCVTFDALDLNGDSVPRALRQQFDSVFVDAPCSGLGTLRRHPEIAWSLDKRSVDPRRGDSLPALQLGILRSASARVRAGGTLVYSTCSFSAAENARVVEAFLAGEEGEGFRLASPLDAPGTVGLTERDRDLIEDCLDGDYFLSALPGVGCDVHFCARMVREG